MPPYKTFKWRSWLGFHALGWLLGVVMICLLIILPETLHIHFLQQTPVGLGMACGVSWMQWLAFRSYILLPKKWIYETVLIWTLCFLLAELCSNQLKAHFDPFMPLAVGLSVIISGIRQQQMLQRLLGPSFHWFWWQLFGWACCLGIIMWHPDPEIKWPRVINILLAFASILSGGPILACFTGCALLQYLKKYKNQP